ncbi:MAG: MFS transporter [Clostridia bacterium]|nr:MFS transporter [Clostridia bacterium]
MKTKIADVFSSLKNYWKVAPQGRFIPFKEIASLAVGGIGVKFIVYCVSTMILSIGNSLIGNTIGIPPTSIYFIYIISVVTGFPLTGLRAKMIDSSRSLKGKYRPYILTMGLPTVLLGIGFIWAPYEIMSMPVKCLTVLLFNIGFQFFYNFLLDANDSIINVLSPNTIERTDVYAVKSVIENISPSIAGIFLPIAAKLITGDNTLYDMRVYRVLYPPMLVVGFLISLIIYVNTQERIVQPKNHVVGMSFVDAFRAVARNKYFWIISLAGWIGFLEGSFAKIMEWMYNYQAACSANQYAIITAIAGNASLWPNLFAPFLIRRFGKKRVLVLSNLMNIVFIALMLPVVKMSGGSVIWIMLVFIFINQLLTSLGHFMNPSLNADIRDYQQYISGERIDGMFSAIGLVGSVITLATSSVLPAIYEKAGLNESTAVSMGYSADNVYDVLYNANLFQSVCSVLIVASVVGAALNVIPLFFYDLTETKQKAMVSVLKIRAYFEDAMNGIATAEQTGEVDTVVNNAKAYALRAPQKPLSGMSRAEKKKLREDNEQIEIAKIILGELNYFNTPQGRFELEYSQRIISSVGGTDIAKEMSQIKALPKDTPEQKEFRRRMIAAVKDFRIAAKTVANKNYRSAENFDSSVFAQLFAESDNITMEIAAVQQKIKQAKEACENITALREQMSALRKKQKENELAIKQARKLHTLHTRANRPAINARKCIARYESYRNYSGITA